jgi:hypothetical protein
MGKLLPTAAMPSHWKSKPSDRTNVSSAFVPIKGFGQTRKINTTALELSTLARRGLPSEDTKRQAANSTNRTQLSVTKMSVPRFPFFLLPTTASSLQQDNFPKLFRFINFQ